MDLQSKYGGTFNILSEYKTNFEEEPSSTSLLDRDVFDDEPIKSFQSRSEKTCKELFVLNIARSTQLTNGYRYIKELLLQKHNYFVYQSYEKLRKNNINVYSVKTDAFTINASDVEKASEILSFEKGIGNWRISKTEQIILPSTRLQLKMNQEIQIKKRYINIIDIPDEFDTDYIMQQLIKYRRVVVLGSLPGVGKSYSCKQLEKLGYNVLLVCPCNELCKNNEWAVTTNTFFATGVNDDTIMKKFDDEPYDVIIFDEIYKNDLSMLTKIKHYSENNPNKLIYATGDTSQNKPINALSTEIEHKEYAYHCISIIFPNQINLNVNKRLKLDKDKEKLNNVKQDILNEDIPIYKTIYKYFKMTNEPSEYNISYRNEIARDVSKTKRQLLNKKNEYEIGEKLMCIEYIKTNGFIMLKNGTTTKPIICKCNKNCSYEIADITEDTMTIKDLSLIHI